jgi:outer membrane protein assembly factor BamB
LRWSALASGGEAMGVTADATGVVAVSYEAVQSLDPADGSVKWRADLGRTPEIAPVRAAIDADAVAVPTSGGVTVLSRADGTLRWKVTDGGDPAAAHSSGPVALASTPGAGQLVIATTENGIVAAFDRATGSPRWRVAFAGSIRTAPQVDDGTGIAVVAWHADGADGHVRALDLATGATRWEVSTMRKLAAPVASAGLVLLSEGDNFSHARIRALDAATGTERWETAVPKSFEWETEPASEGADYVTVDHFGTVTDVDVRTGQIHWQHSDDWALIDTRILFTDGSVVFHDFHDDVVVLDRATGKVRSVSRPSGGVVDAAVAGGIVVTAVGGLGVSRFEARPVP